MNVDELVKGTHDGLTARRVYGDPIERDGLTVIPVAAVLGGGGGGSGEREGASGGGGGFGLGARAVGAYVIRDGRVRFEPAVDVTRIALGALAALVVIAYLWRPRR